MRCANYVIAAASVLLSSCAVYKAAENKGVAPNDISRCETRMCFLSHGMKPIEKSTLKNGQYLEIYRAQSRKSGLNYVRAAGHGALDVATLGIWEVAGTPIESAISNNRGYVVARVVYASKNADKAVNVQIYDAKGKRVK
ncbi:hypothetical protein DIZ81_05070 [Legionella taurinensis]|uniref:Lipoprotein n=1 Tax=Legionella taurinensis TaxID=70611 RepID=A0A3A5LJG0_9GAMM|nr:hypothetical protein [Legionella taurinensis]MDX1837047.1 hypothetical protein [Legionella taurinensis]PUT41450.1 hypothetical protein DB744_05070 [Legionella taurinensis]PUT42689.1 hypothetical protein DB746_07405 [Legionella taurinensis]PUT46717.1 hypothetical protein DB743_04805 [Legionella taurinensis]PUT47366.1 hypothetical protein DB745_08485 [Legionella taurinensis]